MKSSINRNELIESIAMRMRILHLQDFTYFQNGELPLSYFLEKLAEVAVETLEIKGVIPSEDLDVIYVDSEED